MNFSLKPLVYTALLICIFSCAKPSNTEAYLPPHAKSIVRVDLPKLKSKLLTWDNVKNHLFSNDDDKQDFGIDFDRQIYLYAIESIENPIVLIPITSSKDFEKSLKNKPTLDIRDQNGFRYFESKKAGNRNYVIAWKNDLAVVCKNKEELNNITKNDLRNPLLDSLAHKDIASIIDFKIADTIGSLVAIDFEFDTGLLTSHLIGDNRMKKFINENYLPETEKPTLCFTTDSCIFGLSTKVKPEILDQIVQLGMPFLQEYGLLFSDQYADLKPHLDGRIYIGVSKLKLGKGLQPEAKIAFGMADGYTPDLSQFTLDEKSQYYIDKEDFQFIMPALDYIIYSNHKESNTTLLKRNSLLNLQMNRDALNERFFALPKIYFGSNVVESFHFKNLEIDIHKRASKIEMDGEVKCKHDDENSLFCTMELINAIQNQDEI